MPFHKPNFRARGYLLTLLGLVVFLCGFFARSDQPMDTTGTIMATAKATSILAIPTTEAEAKVTTAATVQRPSKTPSATAAPEELALQILDTPTAKASPPSSAADILGAMTGTAKPTPSPSVEPINLNLYSATPQATATPQAKTTATPTPVPLITMPPIPTPAPTIVTPRPGPTPTYEYVTDKLRVEITRHDEPNLVYFATEVWLTDITQLRSAFSSDQFDSATEPVSDIAKRVNALVAINGDFATFNNGGIIIRNGDVFRTNRSTRHLLVIDRNGDFIPYTDPPENSEEMAVQFHDEGVRHTLVFGPVLVANGQAVELPSKFFINTRGALEPRTAIAQMGPLHYLILVVDGRQDGYSKGVSLPRLQEMFLEYGATTAFNLDGGGSATLCYYGNVLNQPANGGQRHVPDILYIVE